MGHPAAAGAATGVHAGARFLTPAAYGAAAPMVPMMPPMSLPFGMWQRGIA